MAGLYVLLPGLVLVPHNLTRCIATHGQSMVALCNSFHNFNFTECLATDNAQLTSPPLTPEAYWMD